MRIDREEDILDPGIRKKAIAEINEPENLARKRSLLKSYEVYKDFTKKYVLKLLNSEMEASTVEEMQARASNISILRKIINKKARVYKNGALRAVDREAEDVTIEIEDKPEEKIEEKPLDERVEAQAQVDDLYDLLDFNQVMKKANRYLELQKNTIIQILPIREEENGVEKHRIKARAVPGHLYDVIENPNDPEEPLVYIFSFFTQRNQTHDLRINEGRGIGGELVQFREGDRRNQLIADSEADEGVKEGQTDAQEYVWWSKHFHFTTNGKGAVIPNKSPEDLLNPIEMQSICSLNKDQDGSYWAVGGEDLVDGSILINTLLTDLYFIAKVQGMGQFFIFGKDLPKKIKVGPNHAIVVNMEEGDPTPNIGFASSNPPIESHLRMIEQYIALLLSTNDLASSTVQGALTASNAASGIQELIVRSEVTSAIEDDQQIFLDAEPKLFQIIKAWQNLYQGKNILTKDFQEVGAIKDDEEISVNFLPFEEFMTQEQKLNIIKVRKELGLDTEIDLLKRDNPDLTDIEAQLKLKEIKEQKLKNASMFMIGKTEDKEDDKKEEEEEKEEGSKEEDEDDEDGD